MRQRDRERMVTEKRENVEMEKKRGWLPKKRREFRNIRMQEEEENSGSHNEGSDNSILRPRKKDNRDSLPDREANLNPDDEFSKVDPELVDVGGYKVKKEWESLLKSIFSKYGDIAKNSTISMGSRSYLVELVCSIYKRLEHSIFTQLTNLELESLTGQIGDLELVNVEIGWLSNRVNLICAAREVYHDVSSLEDLEAITSLLVDERKKAVETYAKELETCTTAMNELRAKLHQEEYTLAETISVVEQIKLFYSDTLVNGLL